MPKLEKIPGTNSFRSVKTPEELRIEELEKQKEIDATRINDLEMLIADLMFGSTI